VTRCVLDASAVLALLLDERGASDVSGRLTGAVWSAVNYAETLTRLAELTGSFDATRTCVNRLELEVVPLDEDLAAVTASLRPLTKNFGLSLADRACLALGVSLRLPVVTADQTWAKLNLGLPIIMIR
jgi:PIN domain nuclease of toxin-antitoxin system